MQATSTPLPTSTLPLLSDASDQAAMEIRRTAADSEISHTVQDPHFRGHTDISGRLVDLTQVDSSQSDIAKVSQQLQVNIQNYTEAFFNNQTKVYFNKVSHYKCTINLLGYDDVYAYTNVGCADPYGSAFSIPFRFEYNTTDYSIIDFKMLGDDTNPGILFPQPMVEAYDALGH